MSVHLQLTGGQGVTTEPPFTEPPEREAQCQDPDKSYLGPSLRLSGVGNSPLLCKGIKAWRGEALIRGGLPGSGRVGREPGLGIRHFLLHAADSRQRDTAQI